MLDVVLKFLNLLEYDARLLGVRENLIVRVVERNGERLPATRDYNFERINLAIENGIVKRAYLG